MTDDFGCQYCHKRRPMEQFARKRNGKLQCVPCVNKAEANVRNHDKAEQNRKIRRLYP